jgi:hypothetical protein
LDSIHTELFEIRLLLDNIRLYMWKKDFEDGLAGIRSIIKSIGDKLKDTEEKQDGSAAEAGAR